MFASIDEELIIEKLPSIQKEDLGIQHWIEMDEEGLYVKFTLTIQL